MINFVKCFYFSMESSDKLVTIDRLLTTQGKLNKQKLLEFNGCGYVLAVHDITRILQVETRFARVIFMTARTSSTFMWTNLF